MGPARSKERRWAKLPPRLDGPTLKACGVGLMSLLVTSTDAIDVVFSSETGVPCDRGVWDVATVAACLIAAGKEPALLAEDGGSKSAEPMPPRWRAWVRNHYRWVVWKLAASSRQFGLPRLTFENVVSALKRRFECEIERASKPFIKALVQRDVSEASFVVLVVARITFGETSLRGDRVTLELSDGWYGVRCKVDSVLASRIHAGLIAVGTKLAIQGARLLDRETAVDPLDVLLGEGSHEAPTLYIEANGVRRARASARLGLQPAAVRMVLPLHAVTPAGGIAPAIDAVVSRIRVAQSLDDDDCDGPGDHDDNANRLRGSALPRLASPSRGKNVHGEQRRGTVVFLAAKARTPENVTVTAGLRLPNTHSDSACNLSEGDLVRVSCTSVLRACHGRGLFLQLARHGTVVSRCSPAPRIELAASRYRPRRLMNGAALADMSPAAVGTRVDCAGIIAAVDSADMDYVALFLVDASFNAVQKSLPSLPFD